MTGVGFVELFSMYIGDAKIGNREPTESLCCYEIQHKLGDEGVEPCFNLGEQL